MSRAVKSPKEKATEVCARMSAAGEFKPIHLFALCGMSPAVVFETVWALLSRGDRPVKVTIITTIDGEKKWEAVKAHWQTLWAGFKLPAPRPEIEVPTRDAVALNDLRDREDCAAYERLLLKLFNREDSPSRMPRYLSVAGGRKSMGVAAATLFALDAGNEDRILHVLVSEPYDNSRLKPEPFLYPDSGIIHEDETGAKHPAKAAKIELTEIPFVPLGGMYVGKGHSLEKRVKSLREQVALRASKKTIKLSAKGGEAFARVGDVNERRLPLKSLLVLLDLLKHRQAPQEKQLTVVERLNVACGRLVSCYDCDPDMSGMPLAAFNSYAAEMDRLYDKGEKFTGETYRRELNRLRDILGPGLLPQGEPGILLDQPPKMDAQVTGLYEAIYKDSTDTA